MKKLLRVLTIAICFVLSIGVFVACSRVPFGERAVAIVSREENSGTRDGFMEYVTGSKSTALPSGLHAATIADSTANMLLIVGSTPNAIGYDSLGYVTSNVKMLSLNGVDCTPANVKNGTYDLKRNLTMVYKNDKVTANIAATKFLEFVGSSNVASEISKGYIVIDDQNVNEYVVDSSLSGKVVISGSTSLEPLMQKIKALFGQVQPNVTIEITAAGSGVGRNDVKDGRADFGMISAELTDDERVDIANGGSVDNVATHDVALDAIAVIVHSTNPYKDITKTQLNKLYNASADKYDSWDDMYNNA